MKRRAGTYVDGFVVPVPLDRIDAYRELAELSREVFLENGALEYVECIADDVEPGKVTSFPQSVLLEEGETVAFAWVRYPSREVRDTCLERVMKDPRFAGMSPDEMPFDGKRMFWGGFEVLVTS